MRGWFAWMLAFALCLSSFSVAFADDPVLEEYTNEAAWEIIYDYNLEGYSETLKEVGLRFWFVNYLEKISLTEEMEASGYLGFYACDNLRLVVLRQDYGMDLEQYHAEVIEAGYKEVELADVNGREFVLYNEPMRDGSFCRVAAAELPDGEILEFVFYADDASRAIYFDLTVATICPLEESSNN